MRQAFTKVFHAMPSICFGQYFTETSTKSRCSPLHLKKKNCQRRKHLTFLWQSTPPQKMSYRWGDKFSDVQNADVLASVTACVSSFKGSEVSVRIMTFSKSRTWAGEGPGLSLLRRKGATLHFSASIFPMSCLESFSL